MSEQEQLESTIVLIDEEDNEVSFEVIDVIEFEGLHYAILLPEEEREDESALVFKIEEDGEDVLREIEDDEEWERVVEYWNSLVEEE